jgi:hypothetical protein
MPSSLTACPVCGYAGVMTAKRGGILNPGPRAQKAFVVLALGGTLLVRCGLQVVTHADDVANVAEITGDLDDLDFGGSGDDDDPYGDTLPQVEYDSPLYTAADGSFTVLFPGTGPIVEDTSESSDGTYELTLHQGDWHVRQITLPAALDPGPDAELPVLVGEISTTLAATVDETVPTEVAGLPAQQVHLTFAGREAAAVVAGRDGVYYELWHTPTDEAAADVAPLLTGFVA